MTSARLRILATTDLHAHALGWDYLRDEPRSDIGLASLLPLIAEARAGCPDTLLFDNGDFLQGSQLGDWAASTGKGVHPMIAAMNVVGYDAATLGNHEISHGLALLRSALDDAVFPVVSANLRIEGMEGLRTGTILMRRLTGSDGRRHPIRIGVTGIAPQQTAIWEASNHQGRLSATCPVDAAKATVTELRSRGADIVILLAHTGIGTSTSGSENLAVPLADDAGADVLVLGHTHLTYPDGQHTLSRPAVMPGSFGSHLGCIDLSLDLIDGVWTVGAAAAKLIRPPSGTARAGEVWAIATATLTAHEATRAWLRQPVGDCQAPLHAHFARIAPSNLIRLVAAAQVDHVRTALGTDRIAGRPVLGAAAPFRTGTRGALGGCTDIPAGRMLMRHIGDIYPHPNSIVALEVTGAELADWLERAVIQFNTLGSDDPDRDILRPDCPTFDFDLVDGLSYEIDLTVPPRFDLQGNLIDAAARRVRGLRLDGRSVAASDRLIIATNSHRASGSGGFPACRGDRIILDDGVCARTVLAEFIGSGGADRSLAGMAVRQGPALNDSWHFAHHPGLAAAFEVAAEAEAHLQDIAHLRPESLPGGETGTSRRFRLWL